MNATKEVRFLNDNGDKQRASAWLLVAPEHLNDRWRHRARQMFAVPLLPSEAEGLLQEGEIAPDMGEAEEEFVALVASGLSPDALARRCGLSLRSVHRRLSVLRDEFAVRSTAELVAQLSARGFGPSGTNLPSDVTGESQSMANQIDEAKEEK